MNYRQFGGTDLYLSEIGFGAWAIGGKSFGHVDKSDAIAALSKAEELGCNFVDTAAVYGESENILGDFLKDRRDKWIVATKYSKPEESIEETLNEQLARLKTDYVDFYQLHWQSRDPERYEQLYQLKKSGKARYVGVSLYSLHDIDYVLNNTDIDGFQIAFSLLSPLPLSKRFEQIKQKNLGVIVRSCLENGFLTGKYSKDSQFTDAQDQRHKYSNNQITEAVQKANAFEFLNDQNRSQTQAAINYVLSHDVVSSVILSCKNELQTEENFNAINALKLSQKELEKIQAVQKELGINDYSLLSKIKFQLVKASRALKG